MSKQPMVWKQSPHMYSAIICETKFSNFHADDENVKAYGGYLVAESVPPAAIPLILRAPQLEAANRELVETFGRFVDYVSRVNGVAVFQEPLFAEMRNLIAKHKGAA